MKNQRLRVGIGRASNAINYLTWAMDHTCSEELRIEWIQAAKEALESATRWIEPELPF